MIQNFLLFVVNVTVTKKKILGCIFKEKIENLDFEVATTLSLLKYRF